jgi:hypothetical protein
MALIGINPVAAPRPQQQDKGPSDFEKLVMGLQAAQSAFGIYSDYTKLGLQKEAAEQQKQLTPFVKETAEAELAKTQAQTGKLVAETGEIKVQPSIREAQAEKEKQQVLAQRTEKIGGDVMSFRQTSEYKKNVGGILAAQYVQRALQQGTGAGDFIAAVETIRGVAGDVGPMKESELDFIKGRMGIKEQVAGTIEKWANNEALTDAERVSLMKAVQAASGQRRNILTNLETQAARDIASKYRDVNFDDVFPRLDSTETFRVGDIQLEKLRGKPPGGQRATQQQVAPQQEQDVLIKAYDGLMEKLQGIGQ